MPGRHASRRTLGSGGVAVACPTRCAGGWASGRAAGGRRGRGRRGPGRDLLVPGPQRRPRGRRAGRRRDAAGRAGDGRRVRPPRPRPPAAATGPTAPASKVVVDVTGKVRRPGIAVLRSGARVVDAIRAAGGARPGVDLGSLNLAQVLTDGEQIVVGRPGGAADRRAAAAASAAPPVGGAGQHQHRRPDRAGVAARGRAGHRAGDHHLAHRARRLQRRSTSCSTSTASATPPWPSSPPT